MGRRAGGAAGAGECIVRSRGGAAAAAAAAGCTLAEWLDRWQQALGQELCMSNTCCVSWLV